jgi:protein-S-isoprenylcysteine O-methyltransferase Ste14
MDMFNSLQIAGIKQFFLVTILLLVQILVFFVSAEFTFGIRSWIFFTASFLHLVGSTVVQYKVNPELLVLRLQRKRVGSKLWDEILMRVSNLMVLLTIPVVAGLDVGRFHWSHLDFNFTGFGLLFILLSSLLLNWAMKVNPHFEPTVRIQDERNHVVITQGPYILVRHPGYLAGILFSLSIPLVIGSSVALLPVGIYIILLVLRTWLEDQTLKKELKGYSEYVKKTSFRLFPGIW